MKSFAKKAGAAVLAAVTSPEAVKAEKSLAVLIAVRVALYLGAGAGLIKLIEGLA